VNRLPSNRVFGIFLASVFFFIAIGGGFPSWSFAIWGIPVLLITWLAPEWLTPLNAGWHRFGMAMSRFLSPVVLTVFYYLIFSPMAAVIRWTGHRSFRPRGWVPRSKPCRFEKPY
jgi:hypothetical protein